MHVVFLQAAATLFGSGIPTADPIPLPAPVGLLKFLHDLTLGLHFVALHLLIGGLVLALVWDVVGRIRGNLPMQESAGLVASRLPIVMTFVINLGVPPLLFAQVLYGQALYTSSVLMAAWWLSVVFLIILAYLSLYRMSALAKESRPLWGWALLAVPLIGLVGRMFSGNMTLMLKPESWQGIYAANPHGTSLPADPTTWPRFALMMLASLGLGAIGSGLWSLTGSISPAGGAFFRRQTAMVSVAILPAVLVAGLWAMGSQPSDVQVAVLGSPLGRNLSWAWIGCVAFALLVSAFQIWKPSAIAAIGASVAAFSSVGLFVVLRDLVRDATLGPKGLDVWTSVVHSNWTVVSIFLASLLGGVVLMGWIGWVVAHASPAAASASNETGIALEGTNVG